MSPPTPAWFCAYPNKDVGGQYQAPARTSNGLKKNGDGTWTETAPDGTGFHYDTNGRLSTFTNYRGATWTLTHDGGGRVTRCTDPFNRRTTLTYDGNNKIESVEDSSGRMTTFTVTDGELVTVTMPELCVTEFDV